MELSAPLNITANFVKNMEAYKESSFNQQTFFRQLEKLIESAPVFENPLEQIFRTIISGLNRGKAPRQPVPEDRLLLKVLQIAEEKIGDPDLNVDYLCRKVQLSSTQLHRKMKALTGVSTVTFIRKVRLQKARELLAASDLSIAEIAYDLGFTDPNYFSRVFSKEFGIPPSDLRKSA